jgi:hypothetical protein
MLVAMSGQVSKAVTVSFRELKRTYCICKLPHREA